MRQENENCQYKKNFHIVDITTFTVKLNSFLHENIVFPHVS